MDPIVTSALLSLLGTLVGTFAGILTSAKLTTYRIEQLEKKVDKHNNVIERMAIVERDLKTAWRSIDELREDMKDERKSH